MTETQFVQALEKLDIRLDSHQIEQFKKYMALLMEWNQKMNLTAITEEEEIWEKHFYDSIVPFIHWPLHSLCDVGSGAGFPGIPLKIVFPDCSIVLLEPLQKRCRFLEEVIKELGLENIQVANARAEDFVKENRERFDVVTARAVAKLSILLELCAPLLKVGGVFVALKGKNGEEEVKQAQLAIRTLGMRLEKEDTIVLEEEATRINLYFKKIKPTLKKYPRIYGQIKKNPLEGE